MHSLTNERKLPKKWLMDRKCIDFSIQSQHKKNPHGNAIANANCIPVNCFTFIKQQSMGDTAIFFYCSDAVLSYTDKVVSDSYNLFPCYFGGLIISE